MDPTLIPIVVVIAAVTACALIVMFIVGLKKHSKRSSQNRSQYQGLPTLESAAESFQVPSGPQHVHSVQPPPHTLPLSGARGVSIHQNFRLLPPPVQQPQFLVQRQPSHSEWSSHPSLHPLNQPQYHQPPSHSEWSSHQNFRLLPPLVQQPQFLVQRQPSHSEWSSRPSLHPLNQPQYHQPTPNTHGASNTAFSLYTPASAAATNIVQQEHQVPWQHSIPALTSPILESTPSTSTLPERSESDTDDSILELEPEGLDLHTFIRENVISEFNTERSQFAVLILSEESSLQTIGRISLFPFYSPVYSSDKLFPGDLGDFWNYLIARPYRHILSRGKKVHAEETLMRNWDEMLRAYYDNTESNPKYMILYTWLSPCPNCTRLIIETFQNMPPELRIPLCVAYTGNWSKCLPEVNEKCRQDLIDAGIEVEHISWSREHIV